jgi:hypothetical protein
MEVPINYLAILVAAIVAMVVGFLWYGPFFGKKWIALMGWGEEKIAEMKKKGMAKAYVLNFIGSLVMAYVLSYALIFASTYMKIEGVYAGITIGLWNWLGFIAPVTLGAVLWEGKPWKLWVLNNGYYAVVLVIMGVILSLWI